MKVTNHQHEIEIKLFDSYHNLREAVKKVAYSKDGENIIGNYGKWNIKYKHDDVEGFVTADGIISRNGKEITLKPGFLIETANDKKGLFTDMINMLSDMVKNLNNPEIVNRENNMYKLNIKQLIDKGNEALKETIEKLDRELVK